MMTTEADARRRPAPSLLNGAAVLAVMARPLLRGAVKSRLAASIGADAALAVYTRLLDETLRSAEQVPGAALILAEATPEGDGGPRDLAERPADPLAGRSSRWRRLPQRRGTLGERLAGVFADLFAAGAERVVIVGSDSPSLPADYLEQAFDVLGSNGAAEPGSSARPVPPRASGDRLVLGPAADGGYYLIGLARAAWERHAADVTGMLRTAPMSTSGLLAATLAAAHTRGLAVAQIPLWVDVDRVEDLVLLDRLAYESDARGEPGGGELREVYLHVTHRCARDCRHCYDKGAERPAGELTTAEWKGVVDQCAALGARSFVFIGGDPLLRDDFLELVDHIAGVHEARVRFFFNSRVTETEAAALALAGRGRLTPLASIDGPREINDGLRGPGSYDDVMTSIANLQAAGLEPVANTVLVRPALAGLTQLARELRDAGVRRLHLILPHQQGGLPDDLDLVPSGEELLAAVRELLIVAGDIGLTVDNLPGWRRRVGARNDLCAAGCRDVAVDPYGNVHACVITAGDPAFVAGSLRERPLAEIWRTSSSLRLLRAARARDRAECAACAVVDSCGGECWVQAHYAARAHDEPAGYAAAFPYCGLVRPIFEELAAELVAEETRAASLGAATGGESSAAAADACAAAGACGGQAAAGADAYSLFDCI